MIKLYLYCWIYNRLFLKTYFFSLNYRGNNSDLYISEIPVPIPTFPSIFPGYHQNIPTYTLDFITPEIEVVT